jgi:2-succinyl-6-hydroxy-2,4-cyclohexadiene-1-carboxylate synthase
VIIVALHGFFGTPNDWLAPLANLAPEAEHEIVAPDLGVWATRAEITDFDTFTASFNRSVKALSEKREEPVMIVGYSMGARLAAQCLLDEPDLYRAALLVSMNPGLAQADLEARRQRVEFDTAWAERMRRDPWDGTWKAWNEQAVLRPGTRSLRKTENHAKHLEEQSRKIEGRREAWARAMEIWSLGHQADLRADLLEWALDDGHRLTLMTGTDDTKFTELTSKWVREGIAKAGLPPETVRHRLVLGAGHRVVVESPEDVVSEISTLLG